MDSLERDYPHDVKGVDGLAEKLVNWLLLYPLAFSMFAVVMYGCITGPH